MTTWHIQKLLERQDQAAKYILELEDICETNITTSVASYGFRDVQRRLRPKWMKDYDIIEHEDICSAS